MNELDVLRNYVSNSDKINYSLRNGIFVPEVDILDGFLTIGEVPCYLYRLLPNEREIIDNKGIITDAAYLSCSANFDDFIDRVGLISHLACFRIEGASPTRRVNVKELLPDYNDEGEYILPRNLKLKVINIEDFEGVDNFEVFLKQIECDSTGSLELYDAMGIKKITLYKLEVKR